MRVACGGIVPGFIDFLRRFIYQKHAKFNFVPHRCLALTVLLQNLLATINKSFMSAMWQHELSCAYANTLQFFNDEQ